MVYILLENGFEECEALTPADILRRGGVSVSLVGVSDMQPTSGRGVRVAADISLSEMSEGDMEMLIIPGGQPGVDNLWKNARVRELVTASASAGRPIAAICAAPIILARLGILDGRAAVCYPSCSGELSRASYLADTGVSRDGEIITGRAAGDAMAFAFEILEYLRGSDIKNKITEDICYG